MKPLFFLLLTALNCSMLVMAEPPAGYPNKNPVIDMIFPDGWVIAKKGAEKFFILSVWTPMAEAQANGEAALEMLTSIELKQAAPAIGHCQAIGSAGLCKTP